MRKYCADTEGRETDQRGDADVVVEGRASFLDAARTGFGGRTIGGDVRAAPDQVDRSIGRNALRDEGRDCWRWIDRPRSGPCVSAASAFRVRPIASSLAARSSRASETRRPRPASARRAYRDRYGPALTALPSRCGSAAQIRACRAGDTAARGRHRLKRCGSQTASLGQLVAGGLGVRSRCSQRRAILAPQVEVERQAEPALPLLSSLASPAC